MAGGPRCETVVIISNELGSATPVTANQEYSPENGSVSECGEASMCMSRHTVSHMHLSSALSPALFQHLQASKQSHSAVNKVSTMIKTGDG